MGSISNKFRPPLASHHHQQSLSSCTRTHQIGALALVATAFFLTRMMDQTFSDCTYSSNATQHASRGVSGFNADRPISWPDRGYGSRLDLKVYVYDEEEIDGLKALMYGRDASISPDSCIRGQWGTQVKIHRMFLKSRFRTEMKEKADLFFVPAYTKCVRMMGGLNDKEINQTYVKVLSQMPYFRLSGGRNHIFVFPSGAGAHLFKSWNMYLNRSIILTPEWCAGFVFRKRSRFKLSRRIQIRSKFGSRTGKAAPLSLEDRGSNNGNCLFKMQGKGDRTDKRDTSAFNTWKDIIIPGNVDDGMTGIVPFVQPLTLSRRKYLANFLGRAQGKVGRIHLIELAKQYPDKLESPELKFSGPDKLGRKEYFEHLRNAKFCLAPRGESSWTLRFYESYFVECVPVLLSDQVELPFQDVIDYTRISIKWPSTRIGPQLLEYLESIPDELIEEMITRGRQVRCLFVYASEFQPCSAINGVFWELQRKIRHFHQSAETFWLHNSSIVNRDLVSLSDWKPPMPLP